MHSRGHVCNLIFCAHTCDSVIASISRGSCRQYMHHKKQACQVVDYHRFASNSVSKNLMQEVFLIEDCMIVGKTATIVVDSLVPHPGWLLQFWLLT